MVRDKDAAESDGDPAELDGDSAELDEDPAKLVGDPAELVGDTAELDGDTAMCGRAGGDDERVSGGGKSEVLPKHSIFLSHSGSDKSFVRHLNAEFEKLHYYPFFDQSEDSLPFGEKFEELIDKAAKDCQIAVIVLSEPFLTSKWPMKELVTFVKAMGRLESRKPDKTARTNCDNPSLKLAPLFYKVNPDQLKNGLKKGEYWKKLLWNELVNTHAMPDHGKDFTQIQYDDTAVELKDFITKEDYNKALKELSAVNGLKFEKSGSDDVKYMKQVLKGVLQHVPRQLSVDVKDIKAYQRLCESIEKMFVDKRLVPHSTERKFVEEQRRLYLGLYGKAGVGKSTVCCEAMFQYFCESRRNFRGYCRVRLEHDEAADAKGSDYKGTAYRKRVERIKSAIRQLIGMPKILTKVVTELEARKFLSKQLLVLNQPVFLVVDNVSDSSLDEARWYADLSCEWLPSGSHVLLTSRSRDTLVSLHPRMENACKPFPSLNADESVSLFLSKAVPIPKLFSELSNSDAKLVNTCLSRCCIDHDFIPRLLLKFASFLCESTKGDINGWEDYVEEADSILELEYDKLDDMSKLIFLDLAIFAKDMHFTHLDFHAELEWSEHSNYRRVVDFIAMLHDISRHLANKKVKQLQNASLLMESKTVISVSEDYIEFARSSAILRPTGVEKLCMICSKEDEEDFVDGTLRVILEEVVFNYDLYTLREWGTVQFLCLVDVKKLKILNLQGLRSLRVLKVVDCIDLKEIVCTCNLSSTDGRFCHQQQRGCLSELRVVQLSNLYCLKKVSFPEHSRKVESLWFYECSELDCLPDLRYCKKLKRLRLPCGDFDGFHGLSSNTELTELAFHWDATTVRNLNKNMWIKLVQDVMSLGNLKILDIVDEHQVYDWIPAEVSVDVEKLVHLTFLDLSCASSVKTVKSLESLSRLTSLSLYGCCELVEVPDLSVCFKKFKGRVAPLANIIVFS